MFATFCTELSEALDERGLTEDERENLYPEAQLLSDHVKIRKISSVVIVDGRKTVDLPLQLKGKDHILIKS